jgi:hypothetical protein
MLVDSRCMGTCRRHIVMFTAVCDQHQYFQYVQLMLQSPLTAQQGHHAAYVLCCVGPAACSVMGTTGLLVSHALLKERL